MTNEDDPQTTAEVYTSVSDFLKEIASDMVFENKQSVNEAMNTDKLMYIELLSIKMKKIKKHEMQVGKYPLPSFIGRSNFFREV